MAIEKPSKIYCPDCDEQLTIVAVSDQKVDEWICKNHGSVEKGILKNF